MADLAQEKERLAKEKEGLQAQKEAELHKLAEERERSEAQIRKLAEEMNKAPPSLLSVLCSHFPILFRVDLT